MEYENGIDLGLGLYCGDSSSKTVKKDAAAVVIPTDDGDKDKAEGLNNFFQSANQKQDADVDNQQDGRVKPQGSFFEKLSMGSNIKSTNDHDDGEASFTASKRKMFSNEMNDRKRHESEGRHAGAQERDKMSHISINTDDGSTAENEDVAESEVECSAPVSNHVTTCKNVVEAEGTKNSSPSSDNEAVLGNMNGNAPYSARPASGMKIPGYPIHNIVQTLPPANGERPQTSSLNSQMAFGYLPTQLPIFTRDHAWGMVTRLQQPNHSNFGCAPDNTGISSERQINDAANRPALLRDGSRNVAGEAEASNRTVSKDKAASAQPIAGISSMIKPGIAADIKFGGSGTCPNLPWVSTTGVGPNGRTISGVTYRFSPNQIKIVCACHGSHLTPEEFVRHASGVCANQNGTSRVGLFPNNNPAASAQS